MLQREETLAIVENESAYETSIKATKKDDIQVCWAKLDRKSKKVNFVISQRTTISQEKATASTIEEVGAEIEGL